MVDVDENNGPLVVQPGSHRGRLVTKSDARHELLPGETYMEQQHGRYFPIVRQVFRDNGREAAQVLVRQGDVVLFHGRLIHGGAPVCGAPALPGMRWRATISPMGARTGTGTGRASRSTGHGGFTIATARHPAPWRRDSTIPGTSLRAAAG